jgi:glycosyltransferase involved in cell wall biosynthesis
MKPTHLVILSHLYPNQSDPLNGIFVHKQLHELAQLNYKITVVSPVPYVPFPLKYMRTKWTKYAQIEKKRTVAHIDAFYPRTIFLPKGFLFELIPLWYFLSTLRTVVKINGRDKIDILHAHAALPDGMAGCWIGKLLKIPLVVTTHGDDLQHRIHRNLLTQKLIHYVYTRSKKIVFVSRKLLGICNRFFPDVSINKIEIIYNGIDIQEMKSVEPGDLKRKYTGKSMLLSVARLERIKGHEWVIKAMPGILKEYKNIVYVIIGQGEEETRLKKLADQLSVSRFIQFLGYQDHRSTLQYMSACDIFVLPSYNESFGIAYLEAMGFAKPVIACKHQGIQDCIVHGRNGYLIDPRDSGQIVEVVGRLLRNPDKRMKMGESAKSAVYSHYTWKINASRHSALYQNAIEH